MLVLTRKPGEQIVIGNNIRITVVQLGNGRVKLGIEAPPTVSVDRAEIHDRKTAEVDAAARATLSDGSGLHNRILDKLPVAVAAGYGGSARNFRRVVAEAKREWRIERGRREHRPAIWVPGETLVIDWGVIDGLHVFCAVLAWSRLRFVRFATNETAATTLGFLAECFEVLGGVPAKVLADRMGCLKSGVVANVVIPTATYVRFATHYGFTPDFCHAHDPQSKGIVERLVGYAKSDLMIPEGNWQNDLAAANGAAVVWCGEVNAVMHYETCVAPVVRLEEERKLLRCLPSARPRIGTVAEGVSLSV